MSYYDEENTKRTPYDQDSDGDYYKIYREYMRELEEKEQKKKEPKSRPAKKSAENQTDDININSFSQKRPNTPKRSKGKKSKVEKKKKIIIICSCVAVILGVLLYFIWPFLNYNYHKIKNKPEDLGFSKVIDERIVNVALFGLDTRDENDFTGRSDSIMILSINTETKQVKVISLMRDTITRMERDGEVFYSKLNNAYFYGGPELAIKTINQNYDLDISRYATINFFGMVDIIDAVGGIDATVTEDELEWKGYDNPNLNNCMEEICAEKGLNSNDYLITSPGTQHLNGIQAVAYARVRHCLSSFGTNDDYGRTDRQRHVMEQLFSKATQMKKSEYVKLAKALLPCSETSLTYSDILSLAVHVLLKGPKFIQCRVPQMEWVMPFNYPEYGSCVYFDRDYAKRAVHAVIYEDMTIEEFVEQNPVERNDWFADIFGSPEISAPPPVPEEEGNTNNNTSSPSSGYEENGGGSNTGTPEQPNESGGEEESPEQPGDPDYPPTGGGEENPGAGEEYYP